MDEIKLQPERSNPNPFDFVSLYLPISFFLIPNFITT